MIAEAGMLLASSPGPYTRAVRASFQGEIYKGLVSTVLRMCQFKTNEYTQTTLLGVELLRVTFYILIFTLNLPQVGNLECNNMASTNQQEFCQPIHCNRVGN